MDKLVGKVAIVTGASSGIGAKIVEDLALAGMKVAGFARRVEKVEELATKVRNCSAKNPQGQLHPYKIDLTNEEDILTAFQWVKDHLGPIHVLVNNAGVHNFESLCDGTTAAWKAIIDINIMSVCICSREAVRDMKANQVAGHIIQMNSMAGHRVPAIMNGVYPGSKHAITGLTETLRWELVTAQSNIRVTSLSPGIVQTEMTNSFIEQHDPKYLNAEDISNAVLYILGTPEHVQIKELTIIPVGETL